MGTKKPSISLVDSTTPTGSCPPRKLGHHGMTLWNGVQSEYRVDDIGGIETLCQICGAADRVEQLANQIAIDGCVVYGKTGPKAHPALRDELANRAFIVRGLQRLGLNIESVKPQGRPAGWSPISG